MMTRVRVDWELMVNVKAKAKLVVADGGRGFENGKQNRVMPVPCRVLIDVIRYPSTFNRTKLPNSAYIFREEIPLISSARAT